MLSAQIPEYRDTVVTTSILIHITLIQYRLNLLFRGTTTKCGRSLTVPSNFPGLIKIASVRPTYAGWYSIMIPQLLPYAISIGCILLVESFMQCSKRDTKGLWMSAAVRMP